MKKIDKIAKEYGIERIFPCGEFVAKVDIENLEQNGISQHFENNEKHGELVLVTAMTSNKSGVGKTTVSIGLADAMNKLGEKTMLALREPSMGPVFGIKGGATGGGKSQVVPSDEINLHFTGDFHAITQANNLLVSILDNHIFQGNALDVDLQKIFVKRCLDLNDRSLREISYEINGKEVKSGFVITAASEVMAILALSRNFAELKENLGNILVALNKKGEPIFARDLQAENAMTILLKEAMKPNLVQTLQGTLALVHLGPFANIAHGCNSVVATKFALSHADFCVTEAGFGSDLGAEKFLDIKCRMMKEKPSVIVLVVTLDVVKEQGEGDFVRGFENVKKHIENCKFFGVPTIVAINLHQSDDQKEIKNLKEMCENLGVETVICDPYIGGAKGCEELAKEVVRIAKNKSRKKKSLNFVYDLKDTIEEKICKIAKTIYGAGKVVFSDIAKEKIALAKRLGFGNFYVNIAKTQFSFSDNKNLLGAPKGYDFHVTDIEIRSGAKMIVAIAGGQILMPGLGKQSNYLNMKIDEKGNIEGII